MRLVFVVFDYTPTNIRLLPWFHVYEFSRNLTKLGHDVVILSDGYPELPRNDVVAGLRTIRLYHIRHFPPYNFKEIKDALDELKPDTIIWLTGLTAFFQKALFKSIKYPIISLIESPIYLPHEILSNVGLMAAIRNVNVVAANFIETFFPKFLIRDTLNLNNIKYVITLSKKNKERLEELGVDSRKLFHIPPWFDESLFLLPDKQVIDETKNLLCGERSDCILLTYCGPPLELRGIYTLLHAAQIANENLLSSKYSFRILLLCRERGNEYSKEREKLIRTINSLGLADLVKFEFGFLSKDQMKLHLIASDLVVLPFRHVTSDVPTSILEAMSLGKAVLSTNIDGIPELIEEKRGILVAPNDVRKIVNIIIYFTKNPDCLKEYGQRAKKYVRQQLSWKKSISDLMVLLKNDSTKF